MWDSVLVNIKLVQNYKLQTQVTIHILKLNNDFTNHLSSSTTSFVQYSFKTQDENTKYTMSITTALKHQHLIPLQTS